MKRWRDCDLLAGCTLGEQYDLEVRRLSWSVNVGGGMIRELESFSGGGGEGRGSTLVLLEGPNVTLDV